MHAILIVTGLALTLVGYTAERRRPKGFTRATAVGWVLYAVGAILLFGEGWTWGLIGLLVPPFLVDVVMAALRKR